MDERRKKRDRRVLRVEKSTSAGIRRSKMRRSPAEYAHLVGELKDCAGELTGAGSLVEWLFFLPQGLRERCRI
jgi:hypothetical protein